jgi:aldehyde dehydrogenase (NAD+)
MTRSTNKLDFDPETVTIPSGHFIGGKVASGSNVALDVRRPSDGQMYQSLPVARCRRGGSGGA